MAAFTGKVTLSVSNVELGEVVWGDVAISEAAAEQKLSADNAHLSGPQEVSVSFQLNTEPDAMALLNDFVLMGRLGPHYKN
jgi:hypothetical protein